ncbi:MAG: exodeoxyribonuclease VII large subunit [Chloroflexota bacterium]|nr:MAG: exodeoxyribonuclease VII large subunit [Chloroflexota bacterium]
MQFSLFTPTILRVSELTTHLRRVVESDDLMSDVWVQGEVSNASRYASGHFYFSLKDENASMRCVMWKGQVARLARLPQEGEAVNAHGHVSVYDARGEVQLYVDTMELLGAGALWQEFEKLKTKLANEGLFDEERKRPLPKFPQRIGIVTSRSGAVIQDIRHILERRYPLPQVFLVNTAVQGADAPSQICAALKLVQQIPNLDVAILARGGGSIEDLWAFNDERVARAIVASRVPVVSGVGHETDFTIADFCADVRAPTPTAAAQFCTPDQNELRADLILYEKRLQRAMHEQIVETRRSLIHSANALHRASPRTQVENRRQRLDDMTRSATRQIERRLEIQRAELASAARQLNTLNPLATLERGYAIVRKEKTVVTDAAQVSTNDLVNVRVRDGEFSARVE